MKDSCLDGLYISQGTQGSTLKLTLQYKYNYVACHIFNKLIFPFFRQTLIKCFLVIFPLL